MGEILFYIYLAEMLDFLDNLPFIYMCCWIIALMEYTFPGNNEYVIIPFMKHKITVCFVLLCLLIPDSYIVYTAIKARFDTIMLVSRKTEYTEQINTKILVGMSNTCKAFCSRKR